MDSLRVFVRRLRAKLGDTARTPRYIETVRGLGYRLLSGGEENGPGGPAMV